MRSKSTTASSLPLRNHNAIFNAGSAGKGKEAVEGVGGTVTGLRPALILCENLTTQQVVVI